MRVGILSTYDNEGGAGRAAYRLHRGLLQRGLDSQMYSLWKVSDDPTVITESGMASRYIRNLRGDLDRIPLLPYRDRQRQHFTPGLTQNRGAVRFARDRDVVNVHWVGGGFVGIGTLPLINRPLVITLHDSWAFTGGCHVPGECFRYLQGCGMCPQLGSSNILDISRFTARRKRKGWARLEMTVVVGSRWLAKCAEASPVFAGRRIEIIHPGMDLSTFKPVDRGAARELLNIPQNVRLVLFGAVGALSDENKGYAYLKEALHILASRHGGHGIELAVFGASAKQAPESAFRTTYLGFVRDSVTLPLIYSAADVTVVPSKQESFGQVASESLACGTPVVAFDSTGLKEIVAHLDNGFLARPFDATDLATGISWVIEDGARWHKLSHNARKKAEACFGLEMYTAKYVTIYAEAARASKLAPSG